MAVASQCGDGPPRHATAPWKPRASPYYVVAFALFGLVLTSGWGGWIALAFAWNRAPLAVAGALAAAVAGSIHLAVAIRGALAGDRWGWATVAGDVLAYGAALIAVVAFVDGQFNELTEALADLARTIERLSSPDQG